MNIICNIVLMIFAADLTGTIFALVWLAMFKYFDNYLRADILNFSLKCVIISFYIPSMAIILLLKAYFYGGTESYYSNYTNLMRAVSLLILVVFIYKLVKEIKKWLKEAKKVKESIIFKARVEDEQILSVVNEVKKKLKIRRKFKVYLAMGIGSPFIKGFLNPTIYITIEKFDREKLTMILTHEMYHYKQRDPFMKPLSNIMCCMHWFNPLPDKIRKHYVSFAEIGCDYKCIKKAGYTADEYFDCIIKSTNELYDELVGLISMAGTKKSAIERAELAEKYTLKKQKGWLLTLILAVAIFVSGTAVYAATGITESVLDFIFISTSKQVKEKIIVCDDGFIEYFKNKNEYAYENTKSYIEIKCNHSYINRMITDEKTEANKELIFFKLINVEKDDRISITVNEDDINSNNERINLEVGIIEPDGSVRYIEGDDIINHTFEISKPGDYQIYIVNKSDDAIKIGASVIYYPREEE